MIVTTRQTNIPGKGLIRVLHVVHQMGRGGIETWLMDVLRTIDRERFPSDFLVYTTEHQAYDDEIRALGSRILSCTPPSQAIAHVRHLRHILATEGPYDVIHVHGDSEAGNTLREAASAGIPIRIAHSHNTGEGKKRLRSYSYRMITRQWMHKHMTHGLGCSQVACAHLFGENWKADHRCRVLFYGRNWDRFRDPADTSAIRAGLGLPQNALVIGHVGRFHAQKNHGFWVKVAQSIVARREDARFLLVGDGALRESIQDRVREHGLVDRFVFTGERTDVPQLLQAMDVFCFPSLYEGLPNALLEAQAVGLPCVVSDTITTETTAVESQVSQLSLELSSDRWAEKVLEMSVQDRLKNHPMAWATIAQGAFSIDYCVDQLVKVYQSGGARSNGT